MTKLFGGSRYLVESIHAKKLLVGIFSQLGLPIQDNALTISDRRMELFIPYDFPVIEVTFSLEGLRADNYFLFIYLVYRMNFRHI